MYCKNCGKEIDDSSAYCPHCGAAVSSPSDKIYTVILTSLGDCDKTTMRDVLYDTFGFTRAEADYLMRHLPVRIASHMKEEDAQDIIHMFETYGACAEIAKDESGSAVHPERTGGMDEGEALIGALLFANLMWRPVVYGPRPHRRGPGGPGPGPHR